MKKHYGLGKNVEVRESFNVMHIVTDYTTLRIVSFEHLVMNNLDYPETMTICVEGCQDNAV